MTCKSKGLANESIKTPATSDNSLSLILDYFNSLKFRVKFNGICLRTDRSFTPNETINLHIVFEIKLCLYYSGNGFTLKKFFIWRC